MGKIKEYNIYRYRLLYRFDGRWYQELMLYLDEVFEEINELLMEPRYDSIRLYTITWNDNGEMNPKLQEKMILIDDPHWYCFL